MCDQHKEETVMIYGNEGVTIDGLDYFAFEDVQFESEAEWQLPQERRNSQLDHVFIEDFEGNILSTSPENIGDP